MNQLNILIFDMMTGLELKRKDMWLLLLMAAITLILYFPSLEYGFIESLDDGWYIIDNENIRNLSVDGIYHLFVSDTTDLHYHPLSFLSYSVDYHLFGIDPAYIRLHNILLHILCGGMVYLFLWTLTKNRFIALFTSFIFLIHPVNMDSVVWAACRRQSLFFLYFMLSCQFYLFSCISVNRRFLFFIIAVVLGTMSIMAKTTGIVFPFVFILIYFVVKRNISRALLFQFLMTIPIMFFFVFINEEANARNFLKRDFDYSLFEHFIFAGYSYFFYWYKAVFAYPLGVFYPAPSESLSILPLNYFLFFLCSTLLLCLLWIHFKRKQYLHFFAIMYFSISIGPMLNLMFYPLGDLPMLVSNRYFYHSSLGVLMYFSLYIDAFFREKYLYKYIVLFATIVCFCVLFRIQMPMWETPVSLFKNTVRNYPSEEFYYRLAIECYNSGFREEAFHYLEKGDQLGTNIWMNNGWYYYYQRAELYYENNQPDKAIEDINTALEKSGHHPKVIELLNKVRSEL